MPAPKVANADYTSDDRENVFERIRTADNGLRLQELVSETHCTKTQIRAILFDLTEDHRVGGSPEFRYHAIGTGKAVQEDE